MNDVLTGCPERQLDPPDYDELPTCCVCEDEVDELIEVNGKLYCEKCLADTFATEDMRRDFIYKNAKLWYEFFADAVDNRLDWRVTDAFIRALKEYDPGNDTEKFCGVYAEDKFIEFVKGEVA